jgi:two-component system LytT family response regulator
LQRVERNAINLLRAEGNYVEVHTRDRRFVLRNSLRETITQLGEERFIQVNRHTAVNIGHLERVDCDSLELDGQCITLSRCYRENLMSHLNILCCR